MSAQEIDQDDEGSMTAHTCDVAKFIQEHSFALCEAEDPDVP